MPLALLALAVGAFGIGTTEFVMMGLLPDVADDLNISIPSAGHLVSAYALGVVIGAPLLAAVTARMSRRTVLIGLMGLFVAGNALSAFAPDYHWLLAARFLSGLPHGAFFGVGAVVATDMVAPERKARSVSLMFLGLTVANVVGVPVATLMGQHLGWRATFLGVSAIGLAAIAALALLIPHDHAHAPAGGPARRTRRPALPPGLAGARHDRRRLRRALLRVQLHHADAHGRRRLRRRQRDAAAGAVRRRRDGGQPAGRPARRPLAAGHPVRRPDLAGRGPGPVPAADVARSGAPPWR